MIQLPFAVVRVVAVGICAAGLLLAGCTQESVRVALESQRRADQVQQTVFDRQHEGLCVLLYRDLVQRLASAADEFNEAQRAALNEVWNERDLIEFWAVQHERAKALRLAGVDAKLFSDQSIVDLMWKSAAAKADRVQQGLAAAAAEAVPAETQRPSDEETE